MLPKPHLQSLKPEIQNQQHLLLKSGWRQGWVLPKALQSLFHASCSSWWLLLFFGFFISAFHQSITSVSALMTAGSSPLLFVCQISLFLSLGEGNGNPLQYSCLENFMDRGGWRVMVHGVAKESDMTEWLTQFCYNIRIYMIAHNLVKSSHLKIINLIFCAKTLTVYKD